MTALLTAILAVHAAEIPLEGHGVQVFGEAEHRVTYWTSRVTLAELAALASVSVEDGVDGAIAVSVLADARVPEALNVEILRETARWLGYRVRGRAGRARLVARRRAEPPPALEVWVSNRRPGRVELDDGWSFAAYDAGTDAPLRDWLGLLPSTPRSGELGEELAGTFTAASVPTPAGPLALRFETLEQLGAAIAPRLGLTVAVPEGGVAPFLMVNTAIPFTPAVARLLLVTLASTEGLRVVEAPGRIGVFGQAEEGPDMLMAWVLPAGPSEHRSQLEKIQALGVFPTVATAEDAELGVSLFLVDPAAPLAVEEDSRRPRLEERRRRVESRRQRLAERSETITPAETEDTLGIRAEEATFHVPRVVLCDLDVADLRVTAHRDAEGQFDGVRVSAIRRGSRLQLLGVVNGDVLRGAFDPEAPSLAPLVDAWRSNDEVLLLLVRRGADLTLTYRIEGAACAR